MNDDMSKMYIDRRFLSQATISFTTENPNIEPDIEIGILDYNSTTGIGTILQTSATTIRSCDYNIYYTAQLTDIHDHNQGDYVELYIHNKTDDSDITVNEMSLLLTSI